MSDLERRFTQNRNDIEMLHARIDRLARLEHKRHAVNRRRFDGIDQRFDGIDQRLDGIDQRFDGMDQRLDGVDQRIVGLTETVAAGTVQIGRLTEQVAGHDRRFDEVFTVLETHGDQLEHLGEQVVFVGEQMNRLLDHFGIERPGDGRISED